MANNNDPELMKIRSSATDELREKLLSRNLYTPENKYSESIFETTERQRIVNQISRLVDVVAPFKSYDLRNTVYGRLITSPNTPLVEIGLVMLGKQFAATIASKLAKDNLPTIKPLNIFKRGDKVFTFNVDYEITTKTDSRWFTRFLNDIYGVYGEKLNPFRKSKVGNFSYDNKNVIENTGKAQLIKLFEQLNNNTYKPSSQIYINTGDRIEEPLLNTNAINLQLDKTYFNFSTDPFGYFNSFANDVEQTINKEMRRNFKQFENNVIGYGENENFVNNYLGKTKKDSFLNTFDGGLDNTWIGNESGFKDKRPLVWGRDGVSEEANARLASLRGVDVDTTQDISGSYRVRSGLLEYTRNLINVTKGQVGDITRKVFTKSDDELVGFNGSGLWKAPDDSLFKGKVGVRQHTVLDQYNKLAKTIRYNGNKVQDSVNRDSVIPKFHPIRVEDKDEIDNRNLMFSIENLALRVVNAGEYGLVDDEEGSRLPLSEVGPLMGRQMWFAPYGVEVVEGTQNSIETTAMIGRSEPIYNYQYSERTATIRFTLIIDHPPDIKNMDSHKQVSEFFAFGGEGIDLDEIPLDDIERRIPDVEGDIEELLNNKPEEPEVTEPGEFIFSFLNDTPTPAQVSNIFDILHSNYQYEIHPQVRSADGTSFGINEDVLYAGAFLDGFDPPYSRKIDFNNLPLGFTQYSTDWIEGAEGVLNPFDVSMLEFYDDEIVRELYDIVIETSSSVLYRAEDMPQEIYNQQLSERRADATEILIRERLSSLFEMPFDELGINIVKIARGSEESDPNLATDEAIADNTAINSEAVKLERSARVRIVRNNRKIEDLEVDLNPDERQQYDDLRNRLADLESKRKRKLKIREKAYEHRGLSVDDDSQNDGGVLDGFSSARNNMFYPGFYSQTPEEFHRRLTFVQQCMRQGPAVRHDAVVDETGTLRARNSVFGRQPICVLRIGDFFHTKLIIDNLNIDYNETTWDLNPEGFGVQPMIAEVTLQVKVIGGQSLKAPIDALQNAISMNYYANSSYTDQGIYSKPFKVASRQREANEDLVARETRRILETNDD